MKSILVVNIGTNIGGIEKCLINFLNFIVKKECQIDLAVWKVPGELECHIPQGVNKLERLGPGSLKEILNEQNVWVRIKKLYLYAKFKTFQKIGIAWKSLPSTKKKYDIAISFCQNGYSPYYVIDNVRAQKKYLWYHHGIYEKSGRDKEFDRKYFQEYDAIISVSKANKVMLGEHFPELSEKIVVIHNLLNEEDIWEKANLKTNVFANKSGCKIVTVGRISPEKGQIIAIEVARILNERKFDFYWVFVGDGPDKAYCEELVKQYHLEEKCIFVGAQTNPYAYIQEADVYVQTSSVEADPVTIQEAKILAKPIIASDIPAIREALECVENGWLCGINEKEFATKICEFYGSNKGQYVDKKSASKGRTGVELKLEKLLEL